MKITRRDFIKTSAIVGAGMALPMKFGVRKGYAATTANSPNLRKWVQPMRTLGGPNGIPVLSGNPDPVFTNTTFYEVTVGEFSDQLHPDLPNPTKLWGYWDTSNPVQRHLGGVIIAERGKPDRAYGPASGWSAEETRQENNRCTGPVLGGRLLKRIYT